MNMLAALDNAEDGCGAAKNQTLNERPGPWVVPWALLIVPEGSATCQAEREDER